MNRERERVNRIYLIFQLSGMEIATRRHYCDSNHMTYIAMQLLMLAFKCLVNRSYLKKYSLHFVSITIAFFICPMSGIKFYFQLIYID